MTVKEVNLELRWPYFVNKADGKAINDAYLYVFSEWTGTKPKYPPYAHYLKNGRSYYIDDKNRARSIRSGRSDGSMNIKPYYFHVTYERVPSAEFDKIPKDQCELIKVLPKSYTKGYNAQIIELSGLSFHIHVDADRDGKIDDVWEDNGDWEYGKGKKGAVILVNNDNDDNDSAKEMDWENDKIDFPSSSSSGSGSPTNDLTDVAPLEIRKEMKGKKFPSSWKVVLKVAKYHKKRFRIFDKRAKGGKEILGPTKGVKYDGIDLSKDVTKLGMEATMYANSSVLTPSNPKKQFNGLIELTLLLQDDKKQIRYEEKALLRVSPWMMFHHLNPTTEVYAVAVSDNSRFIAHLSSFVGVPLHIANGSSYGGDRWMQDCMEIGFSSLPDNSPKKRNDLPVVLRTIADRGGGIDNFPKGELLAPGFGFTEAGSPSSLGSSMDSFGNLECSPPVKVGSREYGFGRIIYGESPSGASPQRKMMTKVTRFLKAQKVQSPFSIPTDWLYVGHVDEVICFCPMKNARQGFNVLVASPDNAKKILEDLRKAKHGSAKLFQGIKNDSGHVVPAPSAYSLNTVDSILNDATFMGYQKTVQQKINRIKQILRSKLGNGFDFIELPVLFNKVSAGQYIAYTAGVVNMLVVKMSSGAKLAIPKPFGPMVGTTCKFEEEITSKLGPSGSSATGLTYKFIDDFLTYHILEGEIHCGSNSKRNPDKGAKWWEHG